MLYHPVREKCQVPQARRQKKRSRQGRWLADIVLSCDEIEHNQRKCAEYYACHARSGDRLSKQSHEPAGHVQIKGWSLRPIDLEEAGTSVSDDVINYLQIVRLIRRQVRRYVCERRQAQNQGNQNDACHRWSLPSIETQVLEVDSHGN